jgi:[acyl-carrier-protein] S-malonyltransferase
MSVASHCPLLDSAVAPLKQKMQELLKDEFISPIVSNVSAQFYSSKEQGIELLAKQLTKPVLYKQSITSFEKDVDLFIEFGGSVLKGINRKSTKKPTHSVTDMKSLQEAFEILS